MDRTVPKTGGEPIELYQRTYYSLLRSSHTIQIAALVETHTGMDSSLHIKARHAEPDISAFIYSLLRLPSCIIDVDTILIGQIERGFVDAGSGYVSEWERVRAPARRRRMHYNAETSTLAVFIASRSDIDDIVPILTAYQIEWNKMHLLLQEDAAMTVLNNAEYPLSEDHARTLAFCLNLNLEDLQRLQSVWAEQFLPTMLRIAAQELQFGLRLIYGSLADYRRATAFWWSNIQQQVENVPLDIEQRPVYFVSSNTHSLLNMLTGFALQHGEDIVNYIRAQGHEDLLQEYEAIQARGRQGSLNNFLYYGLKKYQDEHPEIKEAQLNAERDSGIHRVPSEVGFDVEAQVIELSKLRADWLDDRLCADFEDDIALLQKSDALILNIDYPLGLAAYELLNRVSERVRRLLGVYVMGKAATLNGRVNDVMIPNVVHDEHSDNTYIFNNCFGADDVAPYLAYSTVLDNQKAITAPGTFLQNPQYMSVFYHEGYTVVEMEAGPYLSAIYEAFRPKRHPYNEIVNLYGVQFDVGFLHYASDTPMSKGKNLGAASLSYAGVEPTYATTVSILRRILNQEMKRLVLLEKDIIPV